MKKHEKAYEPKKFEEKIYSQWEKSGFFNPDKLKGEPYSIMMPPPNVTGVLHLGHALENSLMDVMARYQRLCGKKVLLLPGTDHAAVATQAKVEKLLVEKGIKNPREKLGREKLLKEIRKYAEESKKIILSQIRKMGTSCDWSRLAYTFDDERNKAVNKVFKKMYDDGLIYRGFRAINWSTKGQSTLSDDEIVYVERKAKFYTFKYSKDFPITISTTRPETKLGDTAVAVNPKDSRYKKYIGKTFDVDFVGQKLKLKVIGDRGVDMRLGTGALGVTPAHSLVDYDMAVKNKLEMMQVIGEDGKMTELAGKFEGLSVEGCRERVVKELKKRGLMKKEEEIDQNVGTSDRFGDIVEVLPKTQWFLDVNKKIPERGKSLKQLMKESVGEGKGKIKITPRRFEKVYFQWIDNLRDWCISRQIYWGHRPPVWYKMTFKKREIIHDEMHKRGGLKISTGFTQDKKNIFVGEKPPKGGWVQDEDTLDTWFSSGLWTFSTLGWPKQTKDLKVFHPTDWMQMGHEILFFWMARMILMSTYALEEVPFRDVYIHGMLRDEKGKKFSKSAGNSVDPLDVIKKYGTDALRFSLLFSVSPGQDQRFYYERVESARNLVNKLWNIARYIMSENPNSKVKSPKSNLADKWIDAKFNNLVKEITEDIEKYRFSQAGEKLREFTWSDFADWYIEVSKTKGGKHLKPILEQLLILWHPFIPFVTEAIWNEMLGKKNLIIESWPKAVLQKPEKDFEKIKTIVSKIRNLRAEYKVEPKKKVNILLLSHNKKLLEDNLDIIKGLAKVEKVEIKTSNGKSKSYVGTGQVYLDLREVVDKGKESFRLKRELEAKEQYLKTLEQKLGNKSFTERAPKEIVAEERAKQKKAKEEIKNIKEQLENL